MKVGVNLLLWTGVVTEKELDLLPVIKSWGADGVELPMFSPDASPWKTVAKACDDHGLGRSTVAVLPPGANLIGDEAAERKAAVDFLKACVDASASMGADVLCGPVYSPVGRLVGRGPTDEERARCIEGLKSVGEHAKGTGVKVAVEPLNRFETYFLNTQSDTAKIVDAVGLDSIGQMFDTFHANIEEKDVAKCIADGGKRIVHVHISANDRATPGEDHIDYVSPMKALKTIGYNGWLTLEAFGQRLPELAAATCIWRKMAPSEEYIAEHGAKFIKKLIQS
ncbi:MAG: hypothetical protein AMXMBFR84_01010 [Candidatus Hydrogenedentota bacterium]